MSIHDLFAQTFVQEPLLEHFGDETAVTVECNGATVVEDLEAIVHPEEIIEFEHESGLLVQKWTRLVDLRVADFPDKLTNVTIKINSVNYKLERIIGRTANTLRIECVRDVPKTIRGSGFFDE